jgi:hypothetical protein
MATNDHEDDTTVDLSDVCLWNEELSGDHGKLEVKSLIEQQHADPDIANLFHRAVEEIDVSQESVCFYTKHGILMRKWRPPTAPAEEEWLVHHQVVVPKPYQQYILSLAHETPLSGHLGVTKTYEKVLKHFYWPNLKKDVAFFCRSCHTCQVVGKPNQVISKAKLQPIPAFDEPFSRVMVDCVGPLPRTKSGNEYMLTIMCSSTRFPEAIPLRNIKAQTIVKALIKFFTLVGLPKSIQSDQGSNFMSGIFKQVMLELGIKQYQSSAYHPQSQGALERFHQTLKNMLRTYCFDTEKAWDEGVPLLLFAVRESVQESTGFSPFDLVFGLSVRGPLKLLKEKFLNQESESVNLMKYLTDFREKLHKACELAGSNLATAQENMKVRYDETALDRTFQPGEEVLALLPIPGNPLQARYSGPYIVEKKCGDLNYILQTPDRRKKKQLCHINMLKSYVDRHSATIRPVNAIVSDVVECHSGLENATSSAKLSNSETLNNLDAKLSHLEASQQQDIHEIIGEYGKLFSDIPSQTPLIYHDVDVGNSRPIKQHPYRLNPSKQEHLTKEINYLLENDLIEPSKSNWSSPCILVSKSDGTYRFCTDYRKVNTVTKTDTFPLPRIEDCIDKVGNARFVSKFDLLKGFWQVPLTDRAKEISAFVTPDGLFQYKVMPFGMKNSPPTFQRLINQVTSGIQGCEAYIDDIIIYSDSWEDHIRVLKQFFGRLTEANLTVNRTKSEFGRAAVTFLGHVVGHGKVYAHPR